MAEIGEEKNWKCPTFSVCGFPKKIAMIESFVLTPLFLWTHPGHSKKSKSWKWEGKGGGNTLLYSQA